MEDIKISVDQTGERVAFSFPPQRIVSLVPSQTELLLDLGLASRLVGRTKFCVHPEVAVKQVPVVGGTKNLRLDAIKAANPDLVIGNKEENEREQIETLRKLFPVWLTDIVTIADAVATVDDFGRLIGASTRAGELSALITTELDDLKGIFSGRVLYLIWQNPWMAVGQHTFINSMLSWLGFENVIKQSRYPEISEFDWLGLNADYVFLSSEPYPFKASHLPALQIAFPDSKVHLVDGEMFSWYGSRLLKCGEYFYQLHKQLRN